jgi:hypothetical protein
MTSETEIPWPDWVLRSIASDDQEAFLDAIWSVGGSPPYGGVSYEEAEAVHNLLEDYRGPGMANRKIYDAVRRFIQKDPYRQSVLDLFYINDQITSNPDSYTAQMVSQGLALSENINHDGMRGTFLCYQSGLAYRNGDLTTAMETNMNALQLFLQLADKDPVYAKRAAQCAQNAVSFMQASGNTEGSRQLYEKLAPIFEGFDFDGE